MATAGELLILARSQLGVRESPAGSNDVLYNTVYYGRPVRGAYPWCCVFLWWLFQQARAPELFCGGKRTASCGALASWAKRNGAFVTSDYRPGDLVFFRFTGAVIQHIGMVERAGQGVLITIEGNTGTGNDANGGQVQRRSRALKFVVGAYRPQYEEETMAIKTQTVQQTLYEYLSDIPPKFQPEIGALMDAKILQGDGSDPTGRGSRINLTHEQVRVLVLAYRGGAFDRALQAAGLAPAVG